MIYGAAAGRDRVGRLESLGGHFRGLAVVQGCGEGYISLGHGVKRRCGGGSMVVVWAEFGAWACKMVELSRAVRHRPLLLESRSRRLDLGRGISLHSGYMRLGGVVWNERLLRAS